MKVMTDGLAHPITAQDLVRSQATSKPAAPDTKVPMDRMQMNVARVGLEAERWLANVALWQLKLGQQGKLEKIDSSAMQSSFNTMTSNVAKIAEPSEKERWEANRDLWQIALSQTGISAQLDAMKGALGRMQANVAKIGDGAEKERWQANSDLWQATIGQV